MLAEDELEINDEDIGIQHLHVQPQGNPAQLNHATPVDHSELRAYIVQVLDGVFLKEISEETLKKHSICHTTEVPSYGQVQKSTLVAKLNVSPVGGISRNRSLQSEQS